MRHGRGGPLAPRPVLAFVAIVCHLHAVSPSVWVAGSARCPPRWSHGACFALLTLAVVSRPLHTSAVALVNGFGHLRHGVLAWRFLCGWHCVSSLAHAHQAVKIVKFGKGCVRWRFVLISLITFGPRGAMRFASPRWNGVESYIQPPVSSGVAALRCGGSCLVSLLTSDNFFWSRYGWTCHVREVGQFIITRKLTHCCAAAFGNGVFGRIFRGSVGR